MRKLITLAIIIVAFASIARAQGPSTDSQQTSSAITIPPFDALHNMQTWEQGNGAIDKCPVKRRKNPSGTGYAYYFSQSPMQVRVEVSNTENPKDGTTPRYLAFNVGALMSLTEAEDNYLVDRDGEWTDDGYGSESFKYTGSFLIIPVSMMVRDRSSFYGQHDYMISWSLPRTRR